MLFTSFRPQVLIAAWTILSCLPLSHSQSSSPSNGSLPVDTNSPQLTLNTKQGGMQIMYDVDPLTDIAGLENSVTQLQQIDIVGDLVLTTGQNVMNLGAGNIAYICCDPSCYKGYGNLQQLLVGAAGKIDPSTQGNLATNQGAIVLYSSTSTFCTFAADFFAYPFIYTMTNSSASQTLESALSSQGPPSAKSTISLDPGSVNNNVTSQNTLGPSPTTAVAMIILYSITGIITALFLVIIITGAVRAHRHPERYGPRNIMGRPRQTRARGIARAMLESLPIVKFGEKEEDKDKPVPGGGDVELGQTRDPAIAATPAPGREDAVPKDRNRHAGEDSLGPHTVTTETAAGTASSQRNPSVGGENNTESGLTCSVCTDDFVKGQSVRVLPCNHKFHPECIDPWLLNVSGTCPLCRVDLRPTADRTQDIDDDLANSPNPYLESDLNAVEHPDGHAWNEIDLSGNNAEGSMANRRRSNGLSLYIHHTLNFRRMRDATPEERLDALRRVRGVNRANRGDTEGSDRTRSRGTSRLSRLWGAPHASSRDGTVPASGDGETTEGDSS